MEAPSLPSIGLNGKRFELPASNNSDKVKHCDQKKGLEKNRKKARKKTSNKSTKRSKSKNKALKSTATVKTAVKVNAADHGGVKANVSVGAEKTGKKSVKKRKKKASSVARKKKKSEPAEASKSVGNGNLEASLQAPADNILGNKGGDRLDGPRESNQRSDLGEFSGGWKMRAVLASLLFQRPDLLLMDEPTNHLDMPSVAWLSGFLRRYERAFILISHDREFLNEQIEIGRAHV